MSVCLRLRVYPGNKTFCPAGSDPNATCPSKERPSIPTSDEVTPFHPFEEGTIAFLRHGYYAAVSFMDEQVSETLMHGSIAFSVLRHL
jgi:hypothetical protein